MYNGIGLHTPRGSGTSGHVVANRAASKPVAREMSLKSKAPPKISDSLKEYDRRRNIELQCLRLQNKLEESGEPADQITQKVNEYRESLLNPPKKEESGANNTKNQE